MNKLFILLALIASPVFAQEPVKETPQEINYYAKDFPSFYAANPGSEIEKSYNRSIAANDAYAKIKAQRKETVPVIRVEGTIVVQVQVDDGRYRPRCPYNNCR
jgi:hypothetical protein